MRIIAHSHRTLSSPRSRNGRKLLACLICPKTGATTCCLRRSRLRRPARFRRAAMARIKGICVGLRRPAAPPPRRIRLAMTCPSWSQIGRDPARLQRGPVRLVGKPGIARDLTRLAAEVDVNVIDERHEGTGIRGIRHEAMRHDDLMGRVDGDLAVAALHEAVRGGQDAAVRIGEGVLCPVGGTAILAAQGPALPAHAGRCARSALVVRIRRIGGFRLQRGLGGAVLAARIVSSRGCVSAIPSGVSSPRRSGPNAPPRPHPPRALGSAKPRPRRPAPARPSSCGHGSSPCDAGRWPSPWLHRRRHRRTGRAPPHGTGAVPARTDPTEPRGGACVNRRSCGSPVGSARSRHDVDPLFAGTSKQTGRIQAPAIAVEQKRHHHAGMVGRITAFLGVGVEDDGEV